MSLPPPTPKIAVIRIDALEAALLNLKITDITAAQLLEAVKEEERNNSSTPSGSEQTKALLELASRPPRRQHGVVPHSTFRMKPVNEDSARDKAYRLKFRDLLVQDILNGKVSDPYTLFHPQSRG